MAGSPRPGRGGLLLWLSLLNLLGLIALWVSHLNLAERYWLPTLLAYIPQHPYVLPTIGLLIWTLLSRRWMAGIVNLLSLGFWLLALMGLALPKPIQANQAGSFRVMTYNIRLGELVSMAEIAKVIQAEKPSIVFLQETRRNTAETLARHFPGWHWAQAREVAIFSKYPLQDVVIHPMPGNPRKILEAKVRISGKTITLLNAHYITVTTIDRKKRRPRFDTAPFEAKVRSDTTQLLLGIAAQNRSVIVAGDFNTPPRINLYNHLRSLMTDAFAAAGNGLGYTYPARQPLLRIDYIWLKKLKPLRTWVPSAVASDHRAVVAEVVLESSSSIPSSRNAMR